MPKMRMDDGTRLYYEVDDFTDPWTTPEAVLLHHMAAGSVRRWYAWVPTLARHFKVVRFDMRGHGDSDIPPAPYQPDIERLSRDVGAIMDGLGLARAHFVGASAGAIIGQHFAATNPSRVATLSLVATVPGMAHTRATTNYDEWLRTAGEQGVKAMFAGQAGQRFPPDADPRMIEWFAEEAARTPVHVLGAFVPYMASLDLLPLLGHITAPTLLITPGNDPLCPPATQEALLRAIPNSRQRVIEGAQHNVSTFAPDLCAQIVLDFIRNSATR